MNSEELFKKVVWEAKMLSQPIDFAALQRRGVISRVGTWYRLHKPLRDLPEHVCKKIRVLESDAKRIKVKFYNPARRFKEMAQRCEQMAAKKGLLG